jgi:hypothetical protein
MKELNYSAIVNSVCKQYASQFDDWESDFMEAMLYKESFSENMKIKILEINRKYRCKR